MKDFSTHYVVEDRGHDTPCWIWQGYVSKQTGYGLTYSGTKTEGAHRASYRKHHGGKIDSWEDIDHLCRQRACVNPAHLEKVSYIENIRRRKSNKLTMEKAREMRRLYSEEGVSRHEIAARFGVSFSHTANILKNTMWREY